MSSEVPTPAMTFELRFEPAMIKESEVGVTATNSPLVITPPLAGTFTWLSPHSGVFTPTEPLALGRHYELNLRRSLQQADGQPTKAVLHRTVIMPSFGLTTTWPRHANTNASSEPEIKLVFNADVGAQDAGRFLYFRDEGWQRVPADVRQGTIEEAGYELGGTSSLRTWAQDFERARNYSPSGDAKEESDNPTNQLANLLIATPRSALPLGKGWRLIVGAGLPARNRSLQLRAAVEVPVGDVTPFVVTDLIAGNYINSGASIRFSFSKPLPESLTNHITDWLKISPSPTNLTVETWMRNIVLRGAFQGETWYTLKLRPGFESSERFGLAGSNTFTLRMPRVAPRLYFPALSRDQLAGGNRSFPLLAVNVPRVRLRAKLLEPQTAIHALRGYGSYFASRDQRRENDDWNEPCRSVDYNLVPGRTVYDEELAVNALPDTDRKSTRLNSSH